mmetsp:Transcript_27915/g.53130  ORF Transcript_27915/g.53130 Transcript_27915/m.53130 type:complete len:600 (-) Transcript_27915:251-2050(-)
MLSFNPSVRVCAWLYVLSAFVWPLSGEVRLAYVSTARALYARSKRNAVSSNRDPQRKLMQVLEEDEANSESPEGAPTFKQAPEWDFDEIYDATNASVSYSSEALHIKEQLPPPLYTSLSTEYVHVDDLIPPPPGYHMDDFLKEQLRQAEHTEKEQVHVVQAATVRSDYLRLKELDRATNMEELGLSELAEAVGEKDASPGAGAGLVPYRALWAASFEQGTGFVFVAYHVEVSNLGRAFMSAEARARAGGRAPSPTLEAMLSSAWHTHPACRLVVVTDARTPLALSHGLREHVEVFRTNVNADKLSRAKMEATIAFLDVEMKKNATQHFVILDTDILVVKSLMLVFEKDWDVALTWRAKPENMQIDPGVVIVRGGKLHRGLEIFQIWLHTYDVAYKDQHWYGDQMAMNLVVKDVNLPKTETTWSFRAEFHDVSVFLMPGCIFNVKPSKVTPSTVIIHFKGASKEGMARFWAEIATGQRAAIADRALVSANVPKPPSEPKNIDIQPNLLANGEDAKTHKARLRKKKDFLFKRKEGLTSHPLKRSNMAKEALKPLKPAVTSRELRKRASDSVRKRPGPARPNPPKYKLGQHPLPHILQRIHT